MLQLRVVQSLFGDSLILQNGAGRDMRYILIDGGPSSVYVNALRPELQAIAGQGGKLDLAVVTHIDNDHIIGMLDFLSELRKNPYITVDALWHNSFSSFLPVEMLYKANDVENDLATTPLAGGKKKPARRPAKQPAPDQRGVQEGIALTMIDEDLHIPRNQGFPQQKVTIENVFNPLDVAGVKLWLVGPPDENLVNLGEKWAKWLKDQNLPPARAEKVPKPDDSDTNLSSIMFVADDGQRRILLTGDGLARDILNGLERANLMRPGGTYKVDVFKIPHHGSVRNSSAELYQRVLADTYVLCANGRYKNPDLQTLLWLVDAVHEQGREVTLFATSDCSGEGNKSLSDLQTLRPPDQYHYKVEIMQPGKTSEVL